MSIELLRRRLSDNQSQMDKVKTENSALHDKDCVFEANDFVPEATDIHVVTIT